MKLNKFTEVEFKPQAHPLTPKLPLGHDWDTIEERTKKVWDFICVCTCCEIKIALCSGTNYGYTSNTLINTWTLAWGIVILPDTDIPSCGDVLMGRVLD